MMCSLERFLSWIKKSAKSESTWTRPKTSWVLWDSDLNYGTRPCDSGESHQTQPCNSAESDGNQTWPTIFILNWDSAVTRPTHLGLALSESVPSLSFFFLDSYSKGLGGPLRGSFQIIISKQAGTRCCQKTQKSEPPPFIEVPKY